MTIINPDKLKGGVIPGPKPVTLVTCGDYNNSNIITVSYVGQLSDGLMYIGIRPSRYSNELIRKNRKFVINYIDAKYAKEADYCGLVSGKNIDKFKITKFTKECKNFEVPLIKESPLNIECIVKDIIRLGEHDIFIGKVKSIKKQEREVDWLYHDESKYFSRNRIIGSLYEIGKFLL